MYMTITRIVGKNNIKSIVHAHHLHVFTEQYTGVSNFKIELNLHVSKPQQTICHLNNLMVNITSIYMIILIIKVCVNYCIV